MALSDKGRRRPLLLSAAGLAALGGAALAQAGGGFADAGRRPATLPTRRTAPPATAAI